MSDFFTTRIKNYENQMLNHVQGCREGYGKMAELIPDNCEILLDLGCGTGLELKHIFERFPNLHIIGIDCTQVMLEKLRENYPKKNIELICGDYLKIDFENEKYDCAISFQTMHHFSHESKIAVYKKIRNALKNGGCYIECDYVAKNLAEEEFLFEDARRVREKENISSDALIHLDTPCCEETQLRLLAEAGFSLQEKLWQVAQTAIFRAKK